MIVTIYSAYGTLTLDSEFSVYSNNEAICDGNGNEVDADSPEAQFFVSDLVIETKFKRYIFSRAKLGFEFAGRIGQILYDSMGKDYVAIDLHKLANFDFELLWGSSMKIEYI